MAFVVKKFEPVLPTFKPLRKAERDAMGIGARKARASTADPAKSKKKLGSAIPESEIKVPDGMVMVAAYRKLSDAVNQRRELQKTDPTARIHHAFKDNAVSYVVIKAKTDVDETEADAETPDIDPDVLTADTADEAMAALEELEPVGA